MFQAPEIKHTHTAVRSATDKNINTIRTETHIVHFLVVRNELSLGSQCWYIPNRTCRVDTRGDNQTRRQYIPIQRSYRRRVFR